MALGITPQQIVDKGTHTLLKINSNWCRVTLEEIASVQNGYAFSSKHFNHSEGVPLIRIRDISSTKTENLYSGEYADEYLVKKGDVLIGMDGDFRASKWPGEIGLLNQRVCRLFFESDFYDEDFFFYCLQPYLNAIHQETSAVTVKHLSSKTIKKIPLPLPPLPEQRAIVAKLEHLFAALDRGAAQLRTARAQLGVYRQAVLQQAFAGELTRGWREDSKAWNKVPLGELIDDIQAGKSFRCEERPPTDGEVGILKVSAVTWGEFDELESKTVTDESRINQSYFVKDGDFLLSRANTIELVGNVVIVKRITKQLMLSDKTLRITFNSETSPYYVLYFLRSREGRRQIEELSTGNQASMRNIGQKRIRQIIIPFPEINEQHEVVKEIESRLSVCDNLERTIDQGLEQAAALRQSLLKKAFAGELLTAAELAACRAEADWVPAGELLAQIKGKGKTTDHGG